MTIEFFGSHNIFARREIQEPIVDQNIPCSDQQQDLALLLTPAHENIIFLSHAIVDGNHVLTRTFDQPMTEHRKSPRPVRIVGTE